MNYSILTLIGLLFATSCESQTNSHLSNGGFSGTRTNGVIEKQEAIAKEIVFVEHDFGDAVFQLNNTNAVGFMAKVDPLVDRLEKISKELDTLGPFPAGLRDTTLKKLDDTEKTLPHLGPLQPEAVTITPVMEKYVSVWSSVMGKAGLLIAAKGESPGINPNGQKRVAH
jgi:hypothetical protein